MLRSVPFIPGKFDGSTEPVQPLWQIETGGC